MLDFPALGSILASAMIGLSASAAPVIIDISSTSSPGTRTAVSTLDGSKMVAYNEIANGRIVLYVSSSPAPTSSYAPINVFQFEKIADVATLITIQ